MRRIAIIGLLAIASASQADDKETDRILRNLFGAEVVDKAKFKYADVSGGWYVTSNVAEVRDDGTVRLTGGYVFERILGTPNQGNPRYSIHDGQEIILDFERPYKSSDPLPGNRLRSFTSIRVERTVTFMAGKRIGETRTEIEWVKVLDTEAPGVRRTSEVRTESKRLSDGP